MRVKFSIYIYIYIYIYCVSIKSVNSLKQNTPKGVLNAWLIEIS